MSKRAVLYARVSTDDQADKGYSLPSQLEACRKYAERLGFTIVGNRYYDLKTGQVVPTMCDGAIPAYADDYSGAAPIAERPASKELSAMLKARQADAIIVYQVDRLSRDIVDLLASVRDWLRAGLEVHTCDIGKVESELDIVLVIKGWQGSDERKKIRERTMRGKRAKAELGKVVGSRVPYDFAFARDANNKIVSLVVFEERARIVRLIYRWYVCGDESSRPLSMEKIVDRLNAMGVPPPSKFQRGYERLTKFNKWNRPAVQYILTNEVYAGVYRFGVFIGSTGKKRPLSEAVPVNVPPIVERETWERAQARRKHNRAMARRNAKYDYLLSGLLQCGCGARMHGQNRHGKRFYYICNGARKTVEKKQCQEPSLRREVIEWQMWEGLKYRIQDAAGFERDLRIAQQEESDAQEPKRVELENVEAMLADAEREAAQIGRALVIADGAVGRSLQKEMDAVNDRYAALAGRRGDLQREIAARQLTDAAIGDFETFARDVREGMENATFSDKRQVMELVAVAVTVKGGRFSLRCLLGEWEGEIFSSHSFRALPSTVAVDRLSKSSPCHLWEAHREIRWIWAP